VSDVHIVVFCIMTWSSLLDGFQPYGGTSCVHMFPPDRRKQPVRLHGFVLRRCRYLGDYIASNGSMIVMNNELERIH
jgi:hypothetical protein